MKLKNLIAVLSLIPAFVLADWPDFRGPTGQGHVPDDQQLPVEWTTEKNVTWKHSLAGKGWSAPTVYQGKIFLTTAVAEGDDQNVNGVDRSLRTICLHAKTGEVIWDIEVFKQDGKTAPKIHNKNSHASPSAVVTEDRVFVHFGHQGTACLDHAGKVIWTNRDLSYKPVHGNGGSPIIVGDKLIFSCDGPPEGFAVALNTKTGKEVWRTQRPSGAKSPFSFSTPLLVEADGRKELVLPGSGFIWAYNPETGEELWKVNWDQGYSVVPRPVAGHGMIYASSGFNKPILHAVKTGGNGDVTESHVVWKGETKGVPRNASFLLVGDELYTFDDGGVGTCWDAKSGEVVWQDRVSGPFSASPIYNNGRIYTLDEKGIVTVLEAGREFKKLATNDMGERSLASMGVDGNALLVRTETALYRIEE
ncbi:MAG: outer membrane protein assembly factor BamB [Verrucomicrobiales bacterium]|jgi:outer membrane protein assembly factor BamB